MAIIEESPLQPLTADKIQLLDSGIIYRNPRPHLHSRHAYFPSLVRISEEEWGAGFDIGSAFEAVDVRSYFSRSVDQGRTWSAAAPLLEVPPDRQASTSCRLSRLSDGRLIGVGAFFDRSEPDAALANPETGGFVNTDLFFIESKDEGKSWSQPRIIKPPIAGPFEICSPIFETSDGEWLLPTSIWKDWEGNAPLGTQTIVLRSEDEGKTWDSWNPIMDGSNKGINFWEVKLIRLKEKRILAVCWTHDEKAGKDLPIHYALSEDEGRTFHEPLSTGLIGQTCLPIRVNDEEVLCIYRRMDRRGLWAQKASIKNNQWENQEDFLLWAGDTHGEGAKTSRIATEAMSALRFGLPTAIRLASGEILAAFWCVEDCVSTIRFFRIGISASASKSMIGSSDQPRNGKDGI